MDRFLTRTFRYSAPLTLLLAQAACGTSDAPPAAPTDASVLPEGGGPEGGGLGEGGTIESDAAPPAKDPANCFPLVGQHCFSGYPTAFYTKKDSTTRTGRRLNLPAANMPANQHGVPVTPTDYGRRDGFSPISPVLVLLPRQVDPSSLADETRTEKSLEVGSATILIDAATGERIRHLAEVDQNAAEPSEQGVILRPWSALKPGTRVIVGLTKALKDKEGKSFSRTAAFEKLAKGEATGYPQIDDELEEWKKNLAAIEKLGVKKDDVTAAWHYDVGSTDFTYGVAKSLRDKTIDYFKAEAAESTVESIEIDPRYVASFPKLGVGADAGTAGVIKVKAMHSDIAMRVRGKFKVPLFLTGSDDAAVLAWKAATGMEVSQNGTVMRDYVMLISPAALSRTDKAPLLLYGHGLLRGACVEGCEEVGGADFMPHYTHAIGGVSVSWDWWGLSQADLSIAVNMTADITQANRLTDKLVQAAIIPMAVTKAIPDLLAKDERLQRTFAGGSPGALIDPAQTPVYHGNSLGGIMGTTAMALHPDVKRMVFNVPGAAWSTMLTRSSNFKAFIGLMEANYAHAYDRQVLFAAMQSLWDLSDPIHFADKISVAPFDGAASGRLALWTVSYGDSQVPNLTSAMLQRASGVPLLDYPATSAWVGSTTASGSPFTGSAFVVWDTKRGTHPPGNAVPWPDNDAHLVLRWMPEYQQMAGRFILGDGLVEQRYCLAPSRDTDGKLPCELTQPKPASESELPPLPKLPPDPIP